MYMLCGSCTEATYINFKNLCAEEKINIIIFNYVQQHCRYICLLNYLKFSKLELNLCYVINIIDTSCLCVGKLGLYWFI